MIRIYNSKRTEKISNNVAYTGNPHLYNLNDWVVVGREHMVNTESVNPYVYVTRYSNTMIVDDHYEIIICTSQDQLRELLELELENKVIYVLHGMSEEQIENAMPALVVNTFSKELQIKVNHRNIFVQDNKLEYSLQVNRIFYYETYAFLKLKMRNNNLVFISSEIECTELYTNIGINSPIDISRLSKIDSNMIEFTIADRFNKYNVVSNLVLDFDFNQIRTPIQMDFRVNYLKFVHKAYLTINGLKDSSEIEFLTGNKQLLDVEKSNDVAFAIGDSAVKSLDSNAQVLLRNYIPDNPSFKTNIKRQKKSETIDASTRLIIIYDPNDRGFINAIDRSNAYEVAFNKQFTFNQLESFAVNYAHQLDIATSNIVYLLDDSIEADAEQVYITSSLSIKNSIRFSNHIFNFTNVKISQVVTQDERMFITNIEYDQENDLYEIIIPEQFVGKNVFIKIAGQVNRFEAINSKSKRIGLYPSFFSEVLNVQGEVKIQVAVIDDNKLHLSNSYQLVADDETITPNYELDKITIYTVIDELDLTSKHLLKIQARYPHADIKVVKYRQDLEFEQYIADTLGLKGLNLDEYVVLYPLFLHSQGYEYASYIANGTIYTEQSLMLEIDNSLLDIRTVITNDFQIYIPEKINYFTVNIEDYQELLAELRGNRLIGIESPVSTVESYYEHSPVIDFIHPFSPWDKNNLEIFNQYIANGIFINSELTSKLLDNTELPLYNVERRYLIARNNRLLNIGRRQMKLSIIITTYCNEDAIYDTLKYIVDNIGLVPRDYEILIFDDCSKDNTIGVTESFFKAYPHINNTVRVNPRNMRYPGFGANSGIQIARGKYVHIVDGDDKVINGIYSILNRPKLDEDVVSFGHYNYDVSRKEFIQGRYYSFNEFTDTFPYEKSKKEYKMLQANVTHWNKFFKTSFLRENSLYYLENQLVQDSAFLTDVYYCKPTVRHVPQIGYIYHIGHESVSSGRKGYKLFVDFVNANMKRTPLVDSFFPQYTYTMKRFMIYDEIKDEELESIVDLLREKYATNYRIDDIEFFNKGQLLHKMMHNLIMRRDYTRIRQFLKITEEFKQSSEYNDSKYYDLFLGINNLNVTGHFIVNLKLFMTLYKAEIKQKDEATLEQFTMYYNAVRPQLAKELKGFNNIYNENPQFYQTKYDYIYNNLQAVLAFIDSLSLDLAPLDYNLLPAKSIKTSSKIVIVKNGNKYLRNQLLLIDPEMKIYEIGSDDETIINNLETIYDQYYGASTFSLIIDGNSDLDFNNLYLVYHTAYSTRYALVCLTGDEDDDMFNVVNRYLVNIDLFTRHAYGRQSLFYVEQMHKHTVKIEVNRNSGLFDHISTIASGYDDISTENMELLNKLYHTSQMLRTIDYNERKAANMYLFDFNVDEGK